MKIECPKAEELNKMTAEAYEVCFPQLCAIIVRKMRIEASEGYSSITIDGVSEIPSTDPGCEVSELHFYRYYKPLLEKWFADSDLDVVWGDDPEKINLTIRWGNSA